MLVQIQSHQFELSEPYQPGQTIGPAEAQALNALRAENIRNICNKWAPKGLQAETALQDFRLRVVATDMGYRLAERRWTSSRAGTFEATLARVAQELGRTQDDPEVQAEARRRFEAHQAAAAAALAELLDGTGPGAALPGAALP